MKKFFAIITVVLFAVVFTSCSENKDRHDFVPQQVTVTQSEFFYVVTQIVRNGDTVWDRSRVFLGSGQKWTDVVVQNPFLQKPGRVWQDKEDGRWYVLIYPGEELIMSSTKVSPVFVDTIDAPDQGQVSSSFHMNAWGWLAFACFIIFAIWFAYYLFRTLPGNRSNNAAIVHVNLGHSEGIDQATHVATAQAHNASSERFRMHVATQMFSNPNLTNAHISQSSDPNRHFEVSADYDPTAFQPQQPQQ